MRRRRLLLAAVLAVAAVFAGNALAASIRSPKLGPWTSGNGGFTLQKGTGKNRGKVVLTNLHLFANNGGCPEPFATATVVGKFPVKVFTRGGYSTWGVGRNVGGEPEPMSAKIISAGKTYTGAFNVIFNYQRPATQVLSGTVSFAGCDVFMSSAKPKH